MTKNRRKPKLTRKSGNHLGELNHNRTYIGRAYYINTLQRLLQRMVEVQMLSAQCSQCEISHSRIQINIRDL